MPPPIISKYRGSALLIVVIVSMIVSGLISVSLVKMQQSAFSGFDSSRTVLQAQQYADAQASIVKLTDYTSLEGKPRTDIADSNGYQSEIIVGAETDYVDDIKQRIVNLNVYREGDVLPRVSLRIPRYSKEANSQGVPIGTVITWASSNNPTESGTWLECNGQSCAAYPALVAVLGKSTVPNYTGAFLRAYGVRSNNGINHTSGGLGALQDMAFPKTMSGIFYAVNTSGLSPTGPFKQVASYKDLGLADNSGFGSGYCKAVQFDFSSVVPKSNELRPINVAVRYFIKAA